jgi:cyclin T
MASYTTGWYFSKKDLMKPLREGGTEWDAAVKFRQAMYRFVTKLGQRLELPQLTQSTCEVYFHRFFARRDFADHDRHVIATACLFLAAKVEEIHRKLRDVLRYSYEFQYGEKLDPESEKFNNFRKLVLAAERLVLQTIAFDLTVEHPHRFLQEHASLLLCSMDDRKALVQTAWSFVNDSFASTVCLQFRPQMIAAAAIYLASNVLKIALKSTDEKEWWQRANINFDDLKDATDQILEAFPTPPPTDSINSSASPNPSSSSQPSDSTQELPPSQRVKRPHPDLPDPHP